MLNGRLLVRGLALKNLVGWNRGFFPSLTKTNWIPQCINHHLVYHHTPLNPRSRGDFLRFVSFHQILRMPTHGAPLGCSRMTVGVGFVVLSVFREDTNHGRGNEPKKNQGKIMLPRSMPSHPRCPDSNREPGLRFFRFPT